MKYIKIILSLLIFISGKNILGMSPELPSSDPKDKGKGLFTTVLVGSGFFANSVVYQLQNANNKGSARYLKPGKWFLPGAVCLALAASNSLKYDWENIERESIYKLLLPLTSVSTGYYTSRMFLSSSKSAPFLCATYAALTTLSLLEI